MDFVSGFPRSSAEHDTMWMIVDRLTNSAHFLAIRKTDSISKLGKLHVRENVKLHGIRVTIVSDRDGRFKSEF